MVRKSMVQLRRELRVYGELFKNHLGLLLTLTARPITTLS